MVEDLVSVGRGLNFTYGTGEVSCHCTHLTIHTGYKQHTFTSITKSFLSLDHYTQYNVQFKYEQSDTNTNEISC